MLSFLIHDRSAHMTNTEDKLKPNHLSGRVLIVSVMSLAIPTCFSTQEGSIPEEL